MSLSSRHTKKDSGKKKREKKDLCKNIWQFAVISGLPYFYGKTDVHVIIYRNKDKNTTQDNLVELVGSPVAPFWCK